MCNVLEDPQLEFTQHFETSTTIIRTIILHGNAEVMLWFILSLEGTKKRESIFNSIAYWIHDIFNLYITLCICVAYLEQSFT